MFEAQVLGLLQRYLGKYVYGLDAESLRISVWRGDVELSNLRLKPEALDELNLPITVKSGLLGRLRLKVPWSQLGTQPVVAEFDRLYVVASPREDDSGKGSCPQNVGDAIAAAQAAEQAAKRHRIDTAEDTWLKDVAAQGSNAAAGGEAAGGGGSVGRFRALVDTIIGNLELKISNIHIRYEDSTSNPGHTFCIGVLLSEISAHTVGEDWQRKFVTADALLTLRKGVQLKSLAVYFDCDKPFVDPGHRWDLITASRWDELMLPANQMNTQQQQPQQVAPPAAAWVASAPGKPPEQQQKQEQVSAQHQFLLCPVDGTLRYVRRGRAARKTDLDAEQEVHLQLVQIGVQLHQLQYQSSQKLLQEFDRYAASAPHRHLRPHCRPTTAAGARLWWRYAITVVQRQQQTYSSRAWKQLRMLAYYQRYVTAYLKYLQQGKQGSGDPTIDQLDSQLDEAVILLFRRMAHAKLKELRAKATAAEVKQPAHQQTWVGWLLGTGAKPVHQQQHVQAADATAGELDTSMGVEEWNKLEDVLAQQAAALSEDTTESPFRVRSVLRVQVQVAAVELQGAGGTLLMQASMGGVDTRTVLYPQTQDIALSVSTFGVTSCHGPFISSGLITTSGKQAGAAGGHASALSARVLRNPQDHSADLVLRVAIAPSYVTYSSAAVQDVVGFFKSDESLELSRLQAQAAARTDKLRHMAQLQLQALSQRSAQQKPRMQLLMTLHAPKIAIPDASGGLTLIADLGCFTISTNTAAAKSLSAEEAALYECFVVRVDHVSAYLLDGQFAWPSNNELLEASGGQLPSAASTGAVLAASGAARHPSVAAGTAGEQDSALQQLLGRRARIVPLLYRFGLGMDLQVATSVHPRYPVVRLAIAASPLQLHLSPYRYQQLMTVLQSALASPEVADTAAATSSTAGAAGDKPLWLSEAEYTAKVAVLTWEGLTSSVAKWQSHRYAYVWRGRLYITAHKGDAETLLTKTYWMAYRVVQLQPSVVGGCDNVVAIVPKGAKLDTVTESTDAVIMRAADAPTALELRKRLTASANQMSAVAGLLDLDETAELDASVGTTKDVFEELLSHQLLLQMYGSIPEVSLLIAGRSPVSWWPPDRLPSRGSTGGVAGQGLVSTAASGPQSPTRAAGAGMDASGSAPRDGEPPSKHVGASAIAAAAVEALAASTHDSKQLSQPTTSGDGNGSNSGSGRSAHILVPLEEEVDLVAIKFQGAQVGVTVSGDGFSTEVAMAALTMDDLLVGAKNPKKAHMARSSILWEQQPQAQSPKMQQGLPEKQPGTGGVDTAGGTNPAAAVPPQPPAVDTDQGDAVAFRTITDEDVEGADEFYDADEGDASTPRSMRSRSGSGSGSGASGPFAHSLTISSTTSLPTPFEDAGHTLSHPLGGSADRQHWSQGGGSMGGLRDLLPSMQEELSAGLTSIGSDAEADLQAPSFAEASKSFHAARDTTWQQPPQQAQHVQAATDAEKGSSDAEGEEGAEQELVRLLFARYNPNSANYTGLDVEVMLRLSTLVFYCNRPTVAALMVFGTDLGAVNSLLAAPAADTQDQGPAVDAAADSATTESDSVSDVQLLRSGGDERTLFKLTLQVTKVELLLNYEGAVEHPLAIGSIDNFLLELAVHPATLQLHTSLGNMVVEYGVLPKSNPNRTMLSVRDKQAGSLIDVVFKMHSLEQSFAEPRVPGGVQYMSVVTHLSTVQIVFMNRFLVEFLDYLAAMFAMQAPPKLLSAEAATAAGDTPQQPTVQPSVAQAAGKPAVTATAVAAGTAGSGAAASTAIASAAAPAAAKPVVVLLDVNLEAPVLLMPLSSGSDDLMEVDLGTLQLKNLVVWEMRSEDSDRQKLLVDEMQITLQKVSGCVVADGVRGRNIIREMGGGVSVCVRRPLLADPMPLPPITTAVTVQKLRASLLDTEYALILAILAGNFAETVYLPPEIAWLQSSLLGDKPAAAGAQPGSSPAAAAASEKGGKTPAASSAPAVAAAATAVVGDDAETADMKRQIVSDFSCTNASLLGLLCDVVTTKVTVSINQAQLMLWNAQPQGLPPSAVGSVELKNLWVAVSMTHLGNMLLWLSLPSVCARDLRPGVPKEASLVLSTAEIGSGSDLGGPLSGTGATPLPTACPRDRDSSSSKQQGVSVPLPSLLTLQHRAVNSIGPEPAAALQVRLQRPTLVLDVGFIMKVLHFVAPQAGLQGPVPRPYTTHEVHLGPEPYLAPDHLWLSPEYRIIADAPGLKEVVYDGQGHALVLPASVPSIEHVPLIVVGRGVTLRLRNAKIINHGGLAGVLSLAPGARLVAEESDGVSLNGPEEALRLRNKAGRHILIQASRSDAAEEAPAAPVGSTTIAMHAVGAAVYLIDAHAGAAGSSGQDIPGTAEAAPGISIPTGPAADAAEAADAVGPFAESAAGNTDNTPAEAQGGLLRMLALYLDCGLDMEMKGPNSKVVAQLLGLSVKAQTRLLEDAAAAAAAAAAQQDAGQQQPQDQPAQAGQQQQQVATSILEPCDVRVTMKANEAVQDMNVDVSELQLRMSPDVMQLLLHLQQVVMEPLAVPPASQPLARVDKFVYMWSSHGAAEGCGVGPPYATAGAGGVDVIGSDKGVTVWRPQPPIGYALLGDVLSAGHSQPDHQVVAVAISSGLVTYPLGFVRVWESPGISFWRPVAPTGYVPMGCVASPSQPDRKTCVVVARQAVVSALLSECMMLCTNGNLWCIQNSMGTFEVAAPDAHHPKVPLYDLRSPLGVAPAALTFSHRQPVPGGADAHAAPGHHLLVKAVSALTDAQLPPSLIAARAFAASRAELRVKVASSGQISSTVEFTRIWWDKHSKHPSMTQVSLWRPVPPPGYVTLGDCMVTGMYCPPNNVLVLRDTDPSELVDGRPPLLARPIGCVAVWTDGHKKARGDSNYLTFWRPVAPAGYVAMGLLAGTGGKEPPLQQVRCVRADLATRVDFQPNSPALIFYPYKQRPALGGWIADERAATFVVQSHDSTAGSTQLEGYRLKEPEQIRREKLEREGLAEEQTGKARALQMSLSVGKTNLLLRNLLRTPILELEASKLNLGLSQEVCGVRRCFAYLTTSLWSYNQSLEVWEPIMEPWQLLLHMDMNPNPQSSAGIQPGSWIRLTSPHGCVHVTLAQAALNSCLDALTDWQAGSEAAADAWGQEGDKAQGPEKSGLAAADGLHVYTTFTNTLDTSAYLQLNYAEGRKQVVMLPPHAATPLTQPLPVPPTSHAPLTASQSPPVRLVIDILDGNLISELAGTGSIPELSVKVQVAGRLAKQLAPDTQGMATRAVPVQVSFNPAAQASQSAQQGLVVKPSQDIAWNERFVLALPAELAEQLLTPAPGDNPFEGVALRLRVTVLDGGGERGLGRVLSSTEVPVTFNWLLSQIQALLAVRADAAAAASTTTAKAGTAAQQAQGDAAGEVSAEVAQAATQAGEKAGQQAATKAAKVYGIGLQQTLQLWKPGTAPSDASPGGPEQQARDAVAAATAAAAAVGAGGQPEGNEGTAPVMQLQIKLSLDDSQVSSSWYPHQLMRRRLAHLLSTSRTSSSAGTQLQLSQPSRQGSRPLSTDSRGQPGQSPMAGAWGRMSGSGARNALRLEGSDVWSPFSYTSLRRIVGAPAGAPHSGVVPIRAGPGLVLEMAYIGGQYQGRIRSLCQFYNSTDLVLEVALLQDEDTSWTLLPTTAGQGSMTGGQANVGDVVEEEVFEYERYWPLRGWSANHLSALDPRQFSRFRSGSNGTSSFPRVPLGPGWEWEGQWEVEKHPQLDPEGWEYAFDINQFKWPPPPGAGIKKAHDFVRRRRWVRKRRRVALPSSVLDVTASGDRSAEQLARRVLGQIQPGGSLPLPQDWKSDNKQLQIRPILQSQQQRCRSPSPNGAAVEDTPSHAWSYGVSSGQQSVLLASLEDGASRLLCCPTLGVQKGPDEAEGSAAAGSTSGAMVSPRRAAAAAPACWFTAMAEASELPLQGGVDVLTDWRITAQPPLTLRNDLPVAAHYVLWERPARGGSLVLRQQGRLDGWSSINVYSVDTRQQVCLTFHPEGAEWDEPEPVIISEGFLGSTAGVESTARQLPNSFCVSYTNSQASRGLQLRISMQKHIDTELLNSQRLRAAAAKAAAAGASSTAAAAAVLKESPPEAWKMSYGAALAQGRPLTLSLSVPVWVVNGTQLPISVGVVPISTPAGGGGDSNVPATGDPASSSSGQDPSISSHGVGQLRVLDTEAFTSVTRPSDQVTIMGNSIELLSYPPDPNAPDNSSLRSQLTAELGVANNNGFVTQWAAVFSVMGSRWSSPIVMTSVGAAPPGVSGDTPVADAVSRLPRYDPVLIRARCRDGSVYEVTVRLESAGTGLPLATLVRLDPHMVVSNRTGYTLHMLQPEPLWKALGGTTAAATWLLSSGSGRVGNQGAWIASAPSGAPGAGSGSGSSGGARPTQSTSSAAAAQEATVVLRPGALAVPLSWPAGASRRLLALTLPPRVGVSGGGMGAAAAVAAAAAAELSQQVDPSMWSDPFRVCYPATGVMQVLLPLYQLGVPGEPRPVDAASLAAALAAFRKLFQPQQQQQQQQGKAGSSSSSSSGPEAGKPPKPPTSSSSSPSKGVGGPQQQQQQQQIPAAQDNAPMLVHVAKQTDAGLLEYVAVTVNVSVEMPTPGCLHLVLQSLGGEPQQCLMNCTATAISFRQATPRSAWQLLPPYSATALVLLQPPDVLSGIAGGTADPLQLPSCSEVILRDSDPSTSGAAVCTFDTDSAGMPTAQAAKQRSGNGSGGGSAGASQRGVVVSSTEAPAVFPVQRGEKQALAQVLPLLEAVMGPAGPAEVPGAGSVAIGRTQLDRLLRVIPKPASVSMNQLRLAASIAGQDQSQLSPSSSLHIALEVPALDVSLVDGRPQELLLLSMDGLVAEYHAGNSAGTAYTQVLLRLNLAQLDDMQHGSTFPVVLLPADKGVAEDSAADPLLFFTHVTQPSRYRGVIYTPTLVGHIAALRIQLSETLVWRLYSFTQGLAAGRSTGGETSSSASSSAAAAAAAGAGGGQLGRPAASGSRGRLVQAGSSTNLAAAGAGANSGGSVGRGSPAGDVQQVASADLPLQVDLVALDQVPLTLSFKTERAVRPRWANQMWVFNTFGDMLDLDALQLELPGVEFEGIKAPRSALITYAIKRLQAQALAIAFNVFRSYGVLGTATKLLAVGSNITSTITGTSSSALGVAGSSSTGERVGNVGQGIVRGTMTFGGGLLKGVTGIVADPVAGAKQGGVLGFMTGVGKGLVGVPGQIIGGALSAASQVTEGLDASVSKMKEQITGAEAPTARRRRLPRCIRGDRILTPFAIAPALGLALLHNSGVGPLSSLIKGAGMPLSLLPGGGSDGSSGAGVGDAYEAHLTLPMGNVAMITNYRLLMLSAPEFAVLESEVLTGRRMHVDSVPAGRLLWQLTWDQMLCVELAYHAQQRNAAPDGVIVHRKYRSEGDDVLVHDVRCNPNSNQAVWLFEAITAARHKYFVDPRREARGWRVTPVIAAEQQSNQEMPDVMPSMDFKRVWQSGPLSSAASASGGRGTRDTRMLSIWRPVGPPGYSSLGDVAVSGSEPPSGKPVRMYKDVVGAGDAPGQASVSKDGLPPLALPERFQIVYRDSGMSCPLSIWRPVPPKGYVELGHVVVPAIEEPPLNIVRVMRADLVTGSKLYNSPMWSGTSSDNMYWQCDVWQVDNDCSTFVAVRHDGSGSSARPDPSQARRPRY